MELYRRWHGIELPDYESDPSVERNARLMLRERERSWRQCPDLETPGAVAVLRHKGFGSHVGFIVSRTRFVHATEEAGVIEGRIPRHARQFIGSYLFAG